MFKVSDFLKTDKINLDIKSNTKEEIFRELSSMLAENIYDLDGFYEDLLKREEVGSTSLEHGLAIPHVRSKHVKNFSIAVGVKKNGIYADSIDNEKTKLFFLIASNDKFNDYHLDALVSIAKMIKSNLEVNLLSTTQSKEGFIDILKKLEEI